MSAQMTTSEGFVQYREWVHAGVELRIEAISLDKGEAVEIELTIARGDDLGTFLALDAGQARRLAHALTIGAQIADDGG